MADEFNISVGKLIGEKIILIEKNVQPLIFELVRIKMEGNSYAPTVSDKDRNNKQPKVAIVQDIMHFGR